MSQFERYIGVDYSGAETAESSLKGLRVNAVNQREEPKEIPPQAHPSFGHRKYWTRRGIGEWIASELSVGPTTLVGIDHGFSFPREYFEAHNLQLNWPTFLDDFQRHWPTDEENTYVDFVREGLRGNGALRCGKATWRRLTERRCRAKSVFHFDVQGSVAKSTHSGIPWLRFIRAHTLGAQMITGMRSLWIFGRSMRCAVLFMTLGATMTAAQSATDALKSGFENPPQGARPRVWWHWMGGNVSKEGIQLDLEWMHRVGLGGFQAFEGSMMTPELLPHPVGYMTPEWKDAFRYAVTLGDKYGFEMAIAGSPGWSESGGPWVQPRDAMKKIVWSETRIAGGALFHGKLAQPPSSSGPFQDVPMSKDMFGSGPPYPEYYADSEVIAYKAPVGDSAANPTVTWSSGTIDPALLSDGDLNTPAVLPIAPVGKSSWIRFEYPKEQTIQAVSLTTPPAGPFEQRAAGTAVPVLEASDDGTNFHTVVELKPLTHGFAPNGNVTENTVAFPPVTARFFRVSWTTPSPPATPPDSSIGMFASKPPTEYRINELVLHAGARVHHFEEKAGFSTAPDLNGEPTPEGAPGGAIAKGDVVNLTGKMQPDGTIDWTPPSGGDWVVLRFGASLTGAKNSPAPADATGPEVDKFDRVAVKEYLEHYLSLYKEAVGPELMGKHGVGYLVNDSWEAGNQTWTANMVARFTELRGYDPRPWMPVLAGRVVESAAASDRFLWDYRKTIGDLIATEHYGQIEETLHKWGLGHYSESHEDHRALVADGMELKKLAEVPMSAMWVQSPGVNKPLYNYNADDRESASVAHIYGQNIAAAESLTSCSSTIAYIWSPGTLKPTADQELLNGINRFAIHESTHQALIGKAPGISLGPCGQWFNRNETWADEAGPWVDYLARSSFLLQQGRFAADILYYYGEDSNITSVFGDSAPPIPAGFNFDFVNADALIHELAVGGSNITTKYGMSYRLLVLDPHSRLMSLPVLRALHKLVEQGAVVAGEKPTATPSLADDPVEFDRLTSEIFGTGSGVQTLGKGRVYAGSTIEAALKALTIAPDFDCSNHGNDQPISFLHRKLNDGDLYFVDNRGDKETTFDASFRVTGRVPELWYADTGKTAPATFNIADGRTSVPLQLEPWGTVFVVFRKPTRETSHTLPRTTLTPLGGIDGPWTVAFQTDRGAPASVMLEKLISWTDSTDPGVKYFSGKGTYRKTLQAPASWFTHGGTLWLDLGDVRNLAIVSVNGKQLPVAWHAPYRVDVTAALKPGANKISITVINAWINRLIGDLQPGVTTKYTFSAWPSYKKDSPLVPSGLIGPVTILQESSR
jgi:hypothetical protein